MGDPLLEHWLRLYRLRAATLGVALAAMLCAYAAAWLCLAPLADLAADAARALYQQGALPLAHVPRASSPGLLARLAPALLMLAAALAVVAYSIGRLQRLPARALLLPLLALAVAAGIASMRGRGSLPAAPSALERAVMRADAQAVQDLLPAAGLHPLQQHYVLAQLALRTHDAAALALHGKPVLQLADAFAYSLPAPGRVPPASIPPATRDTIRAMMQAPPWEAVNKYSEDAVRLAFPEGEVAPTPTITGPDAAVVERALLALRPEVIHAIDTALWAQPVTDIGMQWQQAADAASVWSFAARLAAGGAAAAVLAWLAVLWNGMRKRACRIEQQLQRSAQA